MKRIVLGILAHVDAGKTTLSEALLYTCGAVDRLGRVDRRDAHLDTHTLERERGITIFSKQAEFVFGDTSFTLIDTPGHIDFSCETERALWVEDYAVLVISAVEGVQSHTRTLWGLLAARHIPTFLFVNKTDIADRNRTEILDELRRSLSPSVCDFTLSDLARFSEEAAGCDVTLMREFFETGEVSEQSLREAVAARGIFPCYFGSALRCEGIRPFLEGLERYITPVRYPALFGARVYKIARDPAGARLTYMKITGGTLRPKDILKIHTRGGTSEEKTDELRLYSAEKYKCLKEAPAGTVVAIPGLVGTEAGMGLGFERGGECALSPVLDYRLTLPGADEYAAYLELLALREEDPALALSYDPAGREIRVRLMGEIQAEVLRRVIRERFGLEAEFSEGKILYRETVADTVFGAGHFEPLRHYAEVWLRLEPLPRGEGLVYASECSTDVLARNWQRLILSHLEERVHRGRLTGSPLTDMKITLVAGRAHPKHTEGGDFRQAVFRALRQGLMKAECTLLEPTFDFRMELPAEYVGRAMTDIANRHGKTEPPLYRDGVAVLVGNGPVATLRSYAIDLRAYTHGEGRVYFSVGEYAPCHNAAEVIAASGYDPELDERDSGGSVFCRAGAGVSVPWSESDAYMHTAPPGWEREEETEEIPAAPIPRKTAYRDAVEEDKELMRIFEATYGKITPRRTEERQENAAPAPSVPRRAAKPRPRGEEYLIVDGYNLIFGWDRLRKIADEDLSHARDLLIGILSNYAGYRRCRVILVYDAYLRRGGDGSAETVGGITVVYTREAQTADAYIERATHDLDARHTVRVVTSDRQEQYIVLGNGALRVGVREFVEELEETSRQIAEMLGP